MRFRALILVTGVVIAAFPSRSSAEFTLGAAGNYAVLGGSTATNTGVSVIGGGNVGVSPGSRDHGISPGGRGATLRGPDGGGGPGPGPA